MQQRRTRVLTSVCLCAPMLHSQAIQAYEAHLEDHATEAYPPGCEWPAAEYHRAAGGAVNSPNGRYYAAVRDYMRETNLAGQPMKVRACG